MSAGGAYAFDLGSPVSHVAASLDRAAPAALSVGEMAADYRHVSHGDLTRLVEHEGCADDAAATVWLIGRAVDELRYTGKTARSAPQILEEEDGTFRLAVPFGELKWNNRRVYAVQDVHKVLGDPFNPMSGALAGNARKNTGKDEDLDALRTSMREAGWLPGHPAVVDERGVVISGHRRLAVAKELGIKPDILQVNFGAKHGLGDPADLRRMDVALLSNYGFKKLTPAERAEIAEYLRETRGLSQAEIAAGLGVHQATISRDMQMHNDHEKEPQADRLADSPELRADVGPYVESGQPLPMKELQAKHGVGKNTITRAAEYERGRRDAADDWSAKFEDLLSELSDRGRLLQMRQSIDRRLAALGG